MRVKEPCIVAAELVRSRVFLLSIRFERHVREIAAIEPSDTAAMEVAAALEEFALAVAERAIEEDRRTR